MSTGEPPPGGPQKPKPRPYSPPPGAAKPSPAPPSAAEKPKYQPPPGAAKPPIPNKPSGAAAPAGQAAPRPAVALRGAAFEFSFEQDALLKELGNNLKTVAWVFLLVGIALIARFGLPLLTAVTSQDWGAAAASGSALLGAAAMLWLFWSLRECGALFQEIVEAQAQDVPLLMKALLSLNRAFGPVALVIAGIGLLGLVATIFTAGFALGTTPEKKSAGKGSTAAPVAPNPGVPAANPPRA